MASHTPNHLQALKKAYPWISTPIVVSAPMRVFASPSLATAVHRTGGIGFIGPGPKPSDLEDLFTEARNLLQLSDNAEPLPIGIGFQTYSGGLDTALPVIQKHRPTAVWLFAPKNGQTELDEWSKKVRDESRETQIWIQVGSVADAVNAAKSSSAPDVLVVQGADAGGHGLARGAGITSLVPEVIDALRELEIEIPVFAAGGIADGRGVAAALSLGAVGAVMGTRFLASREAKIAKGYQDDVVRIRDGGQNTARTRLYDELAGRTDWPAMYDGRNVVNRSFEDGLKGMEFEENKRLYGEAGKKGDEAWGEEGRLTAYMGSAVGLIREVAGAGDIVERTREEAKEALSMAKSLL